MADLYADGARGVFIPQHFAESVNRECVQGVSEEDYVILEKGPDEELYWDVWAKVCDEAKILSPDGREGFLWQDGDLWVVWGQDDPDFEGLAGEC